MVVIVGFKPIFTRWLDLIMGLSSKMGFPKDCGNKEEKLRIFVIKRNVFIANIHCFLHLVPDII